MVVMHGMHNCKPLILRLCPYPVSAGSQMTRNSEL